MSINSGAALRPSLPSRQLAAQQSRWLQGARNRLWRVARIVHRQHILELGTGWGQVAVELADRTGQPVVAVDSRIDVPPPAHDRVQFVHADTAALPFDDRSFDLVVSQLAWLWFASLDRSVDEALRVLQPLGALALIEPDYGGMIEWPDELGLKRIWIDALARHGADPFVARRLAAALLAKGLHVEMLLPDRLEPWRSESLDLLEELSLTHDEQEHVARVRQRLQAGPLQPIVHLPIWMIYAAV
jgi:SAM-dependent methyltransferase